MTIDVVCPETGEVRSTQLFVAALGASNYTYVEATWSQKVSDWISSHARAFTFFGGVPAQVVSDNLKAGVTKACFYDPAINRTYADMAAHYDTAVVPARPRKPKDKAKVEAAVLLAERWIVARLRNRRFFGLDELNAAIRPLLDQLNGKVTRHLGASRRDLFETLDKPAFKPLPVEPYVYAEWKQCRAGLDYHIDVGRHYYSVPYQLLKQKLWVRITPRTVEAYFKGKRVASHARTSGNRQHSTHREHMPPNHRFRADWTPERIRRQAAQIGSNAEAYVEVVMRERKHPEQGYRTVWACCGSPRRLAGVALKPLAVAPWRSTPGLTHPAFHSEEWIGSQTSYPRHGTNLRSPTPTSVAPNTSTEGETMLNHPTLGQLQTLKLDGMAQACAELETQDGTADLSHAEWLGLLIDRETASRETKRFESRMRSARLRHVGAGPEDVDYRARRGLDKALFQELLTGTWIADKRNLILTGPCGVGKTWLACALAQAACRTGVTVLYRRLPRLFDELELAHGDGRFPRLFRSLTKTQLLILDDWGPDRLTASQRRDLMEIVEDRYGAGSTLITSQLPLSTWHDVIGEPTFADAILDRIVHNAYRLELSGQSLRKTMAKTGDENCQR